MVQGKKTVSDEEILELLEQTDDPFLTTVEVGEAFGLTRQWAHNRLQELYEDDKINRKVSGSVIWWVN